jgi:acetyl-CoA carboxylase biotin carboxyl carrier protein
LGLQTLAHRGARRVFRIAAIRPTESGLPMNFKDLRRLLALMTENDLDEIEVEEGGRRVRLRKKGARAASAPQESAAAPPAPAAAPPPPRKGGPREEANTINSPMVGTFYRSSSPDAEPFVEVGSLVGPDSVVCIIEAMKVMNEIKAETEGRIVEILVANGEAVEYGQPLFAVERSGG